MSIEYNILEIFEPFLLGYCNCGCGEILKHLINTNKTIPKFRIGHGTRLRDQKGENSRFWNGGRTPTTQNYILIYTPDHPNATKQGYMLEHRLTMEKELRRYLTRDEEVHHINRQKNDNRIENLYLTNHEEHNFIHHKGKRFTKIDTSDRCCSECKSIETLKNKNGSEMWYKNENGEYLCNICYLRNLKIKKRKD